MDFGNVEQETIRSLVIQLEAYHEPKLERRPQPT